MRVEGKGQQLAQHTCSLCAALALSWTWCALQELIDRLEEDLVASRGSRGVSHAPGGTPSATGEHLSGLLADGGGEGGEDADSGDASMLRVLCSQRDRFRHKVCASPYGDQWRR